MADESIPDHRDGDSGEDDHQPTAGDDRYLVDARGASGLLAGDHGIQINYFLKDAAGGGAAPRLPDLAEQRALITAYLETLIAWLGADTWPRDPQFGGPALTPTAIERKLSMLTTSGVGDADTLASQCKRLVILGSPGSGKTWLARRIARRSAEHALAALDSGRGLDEIELPLYTTCSRLFGVAGHIREAVVSSALYDLADLGGSHAVAAIQAFFSKRNAPTVLVIDSLDEAHGPAERLRQAETLPWRIILTSRQSAWRNQLAIPPSDKLRQIGELQPLRYPDDVEPFIADWFRGRLTWAEGLTAQLRDHPALQKAATVPLLLAFFCILGGDQPLPGRRVSLHAKVIRRMLTGRWRDRGDWDPDPDACLETLRDWAWSAAGRDAVSGIGVWADEFLTPRVRQSQDDRDALDHVAPPLGLADADTGMTQRRFIHRTLQEHLVAEYVALRMPAEKAADELLNHLWYDPDWEYAAPAALVMHPQRDQILKELVCRATNDDQFRVDLAAIDACWEMRRFLARVALESGESDWSPEAAQMIGQAMLDLAASQPDVFHQVVARQWPTSNALIIESLLGLLGGGTDPRRTVQLATTVARLAVTAEDRARARELLLGLLARESDPWTAWKLGEAVAVLDPNAEDRAQAREALLSLLTDRTGPRMAGLLADTVTRLDPDAEARARARAALLALLTDNIHARTGRVWVEEKVYWRSVTADQTDTLDRLAVTAGERAQVREALLVLLGDETDAERGRVLADAGARLAVTAEDRAQVREALLVLLDGETDPEMARLLAETAGSLDPDTEGRTRIREALVALLVTLLADEAEFWTPWELAEVIVGLNLDAEDRALIREALLALLTEEIESWKATVLAEVVVGLDPDAADRARARDALLALLVDESNPWAAGGLAELLARLDPETADRARAREALFALLGGEINSAINSKLAGALAQLAVTAEERLQVRGALLSLLTDATEPGAAQELSKVLARLEPDTEDLARARKALLSLLAHESDTRKAEELANAVTRLEPNSEDLTRVRKALLSLLAHEPEPRGARELTVAVSRLAVTVEDQAQARKALLSLLAHETDPEAAQELSKVLARLEPDAEDLARARKALLSLLAHETGPGWAGALAVAVAGLNPDVEDRARGREALLSLVIGESEPQAVRVLAEAVARLAMTAEDQARARKALLRLLAEETDSGRAWGLTGPVTSLNPIVADLGHSDSWLIPPAPELLAGVRRRSGLLSWLAALPRLIGPARTAADSDSASTTDNKG